MDFESGIKEIISILEGRVPKYFPWIGGFTEKLIMEIKKCGKKDVELISLSNTLKVLNKKAIKETKDIDMKYYKSLYLTCLETYKRICEGK